MQMIEVDCSNCKNERRAQCLVYGADGEKAVRQCADSGFRYYEPISKEKLVGGNVVGYKYVRDEK